MHIVIAGGSGFIGQKLAEFLLQKGHHITLLTRKAQKSSGKLTYVQWLSKGNFPEKELPTTDVFINLAGVSINNGRWDAKHQQQIYQSRMTATDELLRIIAALPQKPAVVVNASAIGIYPSSIGTIYTENSSEIANDFLGKTVFDWERKAKQVEMFGVRAVFTRFGVVLGKEGGALPLMTLPYKLFVGGTVGKGNQWVSWVHVEDVIRAISFAIDNDHVQGPVNVVAPKAVQMKEFGKTIGTVLRRPHWLPVPSIAMKLALGQKSALVLEGQHVVPEVLTENGFTFAFPTLDVALQDLNKK